MPSGISRSNIWEHWNWYRTWSLQRALPLGQCSFFFLMLPLHKCTCIFPDSLFSPIVTSRCTTAPGLKWYRGCAIFSAPVPVLLQFLPYNITCNFITFFLYSLMISSNYQCAILYLACMLSESLLVLESYNTITSTRVGQIQGNGSSGSIGIRILVLVPVATQVLPIFPVFAGTSERCNIICIILLFVLLLINILLYYLFPYLTDTGLYLSEKMQFPALLLLIIPQQSFMYLR